MSDRGKNRYGSSQTTRRHVGRIFVLVVVGCLLSSVTAVYAADASRVTVSVTDKAGIPISGAKVFLDGGLAGQTVSGDSAGILVLTGVSPVTHSIRVTCQNYRETSKKITVSGDEQNVSVTLDRTYLQALTPNANAGQAINVVFYPSSTSFDCSSNTKVSNSRYKNESIFRDDVLNVINHTYLSLDKVTDASNPLPENYRSRFNFYYYYNPLALGDAFDGCSGSVPASYWNDVTFADVTVVLYPTYYGKYTNAACQPIGCFQSGGTGRGLMKAPADRTSLFIHETGHAIFGLVDTYSGDTWHYQNDPYPNLWSSLSSCQSDATKNGRDPSKCRQIGDSTSASGSENYWRWDPDPDIMAVTYYGEFGTASTQRIDYVFSESGGGS